MDVRCPILIGRDRELAAMRAALQRARTGDGRVVVVLGESGVGKSRLASAVVEAGRGAGMACLHGRAAASPAPAPYRPWAEAFSSVLRGSTPPDEPVGIGLRPALELLVPSWSGDDGAGAAPPSPLLVGEAALALLAVLGGAIVLLEDLQ